MFKSRLAATALLLAGLVCAGTMRTGASPQGGAAQGDTPAQGGATAQGGGAQGGGAQSGGATAQPPTFRGAIDFIRVDVFVSDRSGRPITDLEQADFEVIEDGKPQSVQQFRVIKIEGNTVPGDTYIRQIHSPLEEEEEARRDDVRLFAFFLDDYHVRDRNAIAVRAPLIKFIETQVRPTDMLAVMYPLTPVSDVLFTRDHEAVINAIQRFEGRKYNYTPRNEVERQQVDRNSTDTVEKLRNQVVYTAIESLTLHLGALRDSRKSVIFVSEGFTVLLPPQMRRQFAEGIQPLNSGAGANPNVEAQLENTAQMDLDNRMRDVYKSANRNNTAFYPLDPRGLAVFEFDLSDGSTGGVIDQGTDARSLRSTQETLRNLALETGGRAIINRNTLTDGLAEMMRDSSFYYLLGYTSQAPADGKFHEIKVRVKRSGVDVRSRRGFWAYTDADIKRLNAPKAPEMPKPVQQALATLSTPLQAARFVRTWVGTERGENGKTRVTLIWEPLPVVQGVRREQAGRVSLLAVDSSGSLVFRGRSPDAAAGPTAPATTPASAPQRFVFEAPPGKLEMRMQVDAAGGGRLDDETRILDIPDLTGAQARLSTPRVFRSRNAREFQSVVSDPDAVPVASREFSRVERLLIRFDAYVPGSEKAAPVAVLLSPGGQKVADLTVAPATAGGTHQIDFALNARAAGEYVVEITLKDGTGTEAKEWIAIRVGA